MTTETLSPSCRALETYLQRQWQRHRPEPIPLQIRCAVREKRLLVLAEHNAALRVDAKAILSQLTRVMQGLEPGLRDPILAEAVPSDDRLLVNLYVRFMGEQKPYAGQQCLLQRPFDRRPSSPPEAAFVPPTAPTGFADPADPFAPFDPADLPSSPPKSRFWRIPLWVWLLGLGLCSSAFVAGFVVMLQPCLLRPCQPLLEGKQLGRSATAQILEAEDWEDLQTIETQLKEAREHLEDVPRWATVWEEAQMLKEQYGQYLEDFSPINQAFELAVQAVTQTKAPPHPVETWESAQSLWTQAIEQLNQISPDNSTYDLAQRKLTQYERYLRDINYELQREQRAQQILKDAEQAAALARLHQAEDESVESWQSAQENWTVALDTLEKVPEGTTAYESAQKRISTYQNELNTVYTAEHRAQLALDLYQQALDKAQEAEAAAGESRWKVASDRWQAALTSAQQIPVGSPYYFEAQTLLPRYQTALEQAQQQFRSVEALEIANQTLNSLCAGNPVVCYFNVSSELLAVQLTLDYERTVLTSGVVGDAQSRASALDQIQELEGELETLSNLTGIALELYAPDGSLVGTHQP
ncbi:MAG: hypothetical protein ACO331_07340 [Prochlorothrix sp.]